MTSFAKSSQIFYLLLTVEEPATYIYFPDGARFIGCRKMLAHAFWRLVEYASDIYSSAFDRFGLRNGARNIERRRKRQNPRDTEC